MEELWIIFQPITSSSWHTPSLKPRPHTAVPILKGCTFPYLASFLCSFLPLFSSSHLPLPCCPTVSRKYLKNHFFPTLHDSAHVWASKRTRACVHMEMDTKQMLKVHAEHEQMTLSSVLSLLALWKRQTHTHCHQCWRKSWCHCLREWIQLA